MYFLNLNSANQQFIRSEGAGNFFPVELRAPLGSQYDAFSDVCLVCHKWLLEHPLLQNRYQALFCEVVFQSGESMFELSCGVFCFRTQSGIYVLATQILTQ